MLLLHSRGLLIKMSSRKAVALRVMRDITNIWKKWLKTTLPNGKCQKMKPYYTS